MSVLEVSEYAYHVDMLDPDRPSLSRSVIHTMCSKSPAHAREAHPRLARFHPPEKRAKREFDIGKAAHEVLLEGEASVDVLAYDNWTTKAAKEEEALSRSHGRIPLLEKEWDLVEQMVEAVRPQLERYEPVPFTEGKAEQAVSWEENGVLCRARFDWLRDDLRAIDDFKTASSSDPDSWSKKVVETGYDIQAVLYTRAAQAVFGASPAFRFVAIEKAPPFVVTVHQVAPDTWALAERKVDWAIAMWTRCLETGYWPGYAEQVCWTNLRAFDEANWLDKEARYEL